MAKLPLIRPRAIKVLIADYQWWTMTLEVPLFHSLKPGSISGGRLEAATRHYDPGDVR